MPIGRKKGKRKMKRKKSTSSLIAPPQDPSKLRITYGLERLDRR